jgi:Dolichyl-phosphate-mannose-protein mannosyltransferase
MPAILAIAVAGFVLRLVPLVRAGGPLAWPVDYDEAVYFSASALLFRGVLPYRDFVFVHPPALLYVLGATSSLAGALGPARAFAAARLVATLVGAINIALVGRLVLRTSGAAGALVAAALYATYPDVVVVERGPFLEPVLNLACLTMALAWLGPRAGSARRSVVAGVLCGAACAVKVWGGIWFLAALAAAPRERARSEIAKFAGAAAVSGLIFIAPLAFLSLPRFVEQTLLFHLRRPPDGIVSPAARVPEIAGGGHIVASVLALAALLAIAVKAVRARALVTREERFFAAAIVLTAAAFLASSSYWSQYNSHLAASECVLAGMGAALIAANLPSALAGALVLLLAVPSARQSLLGSRGRAPELLAVGATIRDNVPSDDCVFAFDPAWSIAGGRLPPHSGSAPAIVDSYGAMLLAATHGGAKFPDAAAAFQSPAAQTEVRARLESCRFAILGWRGNWQLSAASKAWFSAHFVCAAPSAGDLCLWERWSPTLLGLAVAPPGTEIRFGDGWFAEEGAPRARWRWMAARSVTLLPPVAGAARLELALELPADNATITVQLDGRTIERIAATSRQVARSWRVDGSGGAPHTLVLSTSSVVNPARAGLSPDTRDLGLRLDRIVWLPTAAISRAKRRLDSASNRGAEGVRELRWWR